MLGASGGKRRGPLDGGLGDGTGFGATHGILAALVLIGLFMLGALPSAPPPRPSAIAQGSITADEILAMKGARGKSFIDEVKAIDLAYHLAEAESHRLYGERARLMNELKVGEKMVASFEDDGSDEDFTVPPGESYADFAIGGNCSGTTLVHGDPTCKRNIAQQQLKLPRIYVYDLPSKFNRDLSRKYKRCSTDQYGTEVFFHEALLQSELREKKPERADLFYVPIYGECFLWSYEMLRRVPREQSFKETNDFYLEALSTIREKHPMWNRTMGRDHIFSFPGARGPTIFNDWRKHIQLSVYLTPEGDRKAHYFDTWKDVVVPGMEADPMFYEPAKRAALVEREGQPREYLAYFRGTIDHREGTAYSRGLRPRLKKLFANVTDIIYNTKKKDCDRRCYHEEMANSVFCLNPLGWTPWTLRFYQAVMTRCIPLLIADDIEFPYESEIDYSKFAVKMRENEVDDIVAFMRNMPEEERAAKRAEMDRIWEIFTYQRPPSKGDAFYATMRELARKMRRMKTGAMHEWT